MGAKLLKKSRFAVIAEAEAASFYATIEGCAPKTIIEGRLGDEAEPCAR